MALRGGADILVATPGRLLDLVGHNALRLGGVATLVLDEADRLFALGFADELKRVISLLPTRRQNRCFQRRIPLLSRRWPTRCCAIPRVPKVRVRPSRRR
jgi:superfamily II DNA/RNA helicase